MFTEKKDYLEMVEGDFGIVLPIELEPETEETITAEDSFKITIYDKINTNPIITKTYTNILDNTINFELTKQESMLLKANKIYYIDLDWFSEETFLGNILAKKLLKVIDKAGVVNES